MGGADDVAVTARADDMDQARIVDERDPFTAVDRHHPLGEHLADHAHRTVRSRLGRVDEGGGEEQAG